MAETFGQRLARLRNLHGWTQQALADRLALSRVAISHFELGLAIPSERTVILLSGIFKVEPHELVADTFYPPGKAVRLPAVTLRYTETELQLALLERDLDWASRTGQISAVAAGWRERLALRYDASFDAHERMLLLAAIQRLIGTAD